MIFILYNIITELVIIYRQIPPNTTYLAVFGGIWRYLAVFGGIWRYLAVFGGIGRYWAVLGGIGRYWAVLGGIGRYWAVLGGICGTNSNYPPQLLNPYYI